VTSSTNCSSVKSTRRLRSSQNLEKEPVVAQSVAISTQAIKNAEILIDKELNKNNGNKVNGLPVVVKKSRRDKSNVTKDTDQLSKFKSSSKSFGKFNSSRGNKIVKRRKKSSNSAKTFTSNFEEILVAPESLDFSESTVETGQFECEVCRRVFAQKYYLTKHILRKHADAAIALRYTCEICGRTFRERYSLNRHARIHVLKPLNEPYLCDVCQCSFSEKYYLKRHMQRKHLEPTLNAHQCEVCGRTFGERYMLLRHITTHSALKPYVCDVCRRVFRTASFLRRHISVHSEERSFSCEVRILKLSLYVCWLSNL